MTLEREICSIETANINKETLDAMRNAGAAMKQIHGSLTIDKVDQTMYVASCQAAVARDFKWLVISPGAPTLTLSFQQGGATGATRHWRGNLGSHCSAPGPNARRGRAGRRARRAAAGGVGQQDAGDGPGPCFGHGFEITDGSPRSA